MIRILTGMWFRWWKKVAAAEEEQQGTTPGGGGGDAGTESGEWVPDRGNWRPLAIARPPRPPVPAIVPKVRIVVRVASEAPLPITAAAARLRMAPSAASFQGLPATEASASAGLGSRLLTYADICRMSKEDREEWRREAIRREDELLLMGLTGLTGLM
jgi:hypothetical protein